MTVRDSATLLNIVSQNELLCAPSNFLTVITFKRPSHHTLLIAPTDQFQARLFRIPTLILCVRTGLLPPPTTFPLVTSTTPLEPLSETSSRPSPPTSNFVFWAPLSFQRSTTFSTAGLFILTVIFTLTVVEYTLSIRLIISMTQSMLILTYSASPSRLTSQ